MNSRITKIMANHKAAKKRKGLSFVEVGVVTAIIILIASIGVPSINNFVTENRAPKVAEELQRFIARTKAASAGAAAAPYKDIATINLARATQGSSVLTSDLVAETVKHRLGDGAITVAEVTPTDGVAGDGFSITITGVANVVCPTLATILNSTVDEISIEGEVVKSATIPYNAITAQDECVSGNNNDFVFTINS